MRPLTWAIPAGQCEKAPAWEPWLELSHTHEGAQLFSVDSRLHCQIKESTEDDLMVSVRIVPATTGGPARPKSVEINSHHSRNDEGEHNYDYGGNKNQKRAEKDS